MKHSALFLYNLEALWNRLLVQNIINWLTPQLTTIKAKYPGDPYRDSTFSEVWAVLGGDDEAKLKCIYGGMHQPANAHWLLHQKPNPLK